MTFDRFPRLRPWFAAPQLVVFLTTLFLILAPVGSALAAADQGGARNPLAQDESDPVQEDEPSEAPPPEPAATESKPTEQPPVESQPADVPVESKPTEQPVEPKPTEKPPVGSQPADEPAITPTSADTFPKEPIVAATPPTLPPNAGGPGSAPTTLVVVKGLCEGNRIDVYAARSLAELAELCVAYSTDATFTHTYLDTGTVSTQGTIGSMTSFDVQPGSFSLREQLPPGYDSPMVACVSATIGEYPLFRPGNRYTITSHIDAGDTLTCYWLNVLIPPTRIVVTKGLCDDHSFDPYTASSAELADNCVQNSGDATFTYRQLYTGAPNELVVVQATSGSSTTFEVPPGNFSIEESIPAGFGQPVVSCHIGQINVDILPVVQGASIQRHVDLGVTWTCHWYNVSLGSDSHLLIEKWQCPAGYDVAMLGANPVRDCTQRLDGVEFQVEGIENGASFSAVTGEIAPGVVAFPNLEPGDYAISEMGPDQHATAFVWTCTTAGIPASPTTPLSTGNTLTVTTLASWNTICHWYNVQFPVPPGSLTVTKHLCGSLSQQTFLLCPIYKFGQSFNLLQWLEDGWVLVGTGVTDRSGRYTWTDLPPGDYMLDEKRGDWCRLTSDNLDPGGTTMAVRSGEEARVSVYNCGMPPTSAPVRVVSLVGLIFRDIWNPAP